MAVALWDDGDFDYDGSVNLSDFNLLADNFGQSAAGAGVTPGEWSALASAVPEPAAALSVLLTTTLPLLRPRTGGGADRGLKTKR